MGRGILGPLFVGFVQQEQIFVSGPIMKTKSRQSSSPIKTAKKLIIMQLGEQALGPSGGLQLWAIPLQAAHPPLGQLPCPHKQEHDFERSQLQQEQSNSNIYPQHLHFGFGPLKQP
mmetsp:Transcript_40401/g.108427  ORF Transcript_40401/g.108427 Transcript_40401/m.108427 type:complete len:116 (-) Transcript_40401:131-478(-)